MRVAEIKTIDILNGDGLRVSIFVCGCTHYCKGCFNKKLWDFLAGEEFNNSHMEKILGTFNNKDIPYHGLSILGGEPFEDVNLDSLINLCTEIKSTYTDKTIWVWTGYLFEDLINNNKLKLLKYVDVLIDGKFIIEQKDLNLKYRGSKNQRVIDVQKSLDTHSIVLYT